MDFDEEKYEVKSTSDFWADVVKGKETIGDDTEQNVDSEEKREIFKCRSCGYMIDLANPPKHLYPFEYYIASQNPLEIKCPNCNKKVLYDTATVEEYETYVKKKEEKKEQEQRQKEEKNRNRKIEQVKDDLKDLTDDLRDRLLNKEITPKRFAVLMINMSRNIVNRYGGSELGVDWLDFRKKIYDISDSILKVYEFSQNTEEILAEYDQKIEEDELYKAELDYYINDNKFAIPDYELRQKMKEYNRQEQQIRSDEYKKQIEEKYQNRKMELLEKAQKREEKLRNIM